MKGFWAASTMSCSTIEGSRRTRLDVIYLRMDDQLWRQRGQNGRILGPQLLSAVRAGTVTLANALGSE